MDFGKLSSIQGIDFRLPLPDERGNPGAWRDTRASEDTSGASAPPRVIAGAPVWSTPQWVGTIYPRGTQPRDFLAQYARRFGGIELNSTFYGVPGETTIDAWSRAVPAEFRFCPKVPREISHGEATGARLEEQVERFARAMRRLGPLLGLAFLQLPPGFTPRQRERLKAIQAAFGPEFPLAIEFRHPDWFEGRSQGRGRIRAGAFEWMAERGLSAVITDVAGRRDVLHASLPAPRTLIRFVGNGLDPTDFARIDDWAARLGEWLERGVREIFFFVHQPGNIRSPELLQYFGRRMQELHGIRLRCGTAPEEPGRLDQLEMFR